MTLDSSCYTYVVWMIVLDKIQKSYAPSYDYLNIREFVSCLRVAIPHSDSESEDTWIYICSLLILAMKMLDNWLVLVQRATVNHWTGVFTSTGAAYF